MNKNYKDNDIKIIKSKPITFLKKVRGQGKIKVRFAPSPTGYFHIGSARTALFNYLFAKKYNGEFILRIEDTDRARIVPGSLNDIKESLKWIGVKWDKLYIQSERMEIYKKYALELAEKEKAYYCFCPPERLENLRKEREAKKLPPMYDGKCRDLTKEEIKENLKKQEKFVIRQKVPKDGITEFNDIIRGNIKFENKLIDDSVLLKSDGYPTYHLANVVDDYLMKISHVIRAEEWLPSTPKHILIYKAFGWKIPEFAHLPMVLGTDHSKLSKRHGATSVKEYREQGYLPEALINFIALLGWAPHDNREIFSLKELIKEFSLERVQKGGAIFNIEKLDWINGQYIKKTSVKKLTELCLPYLLPAGRQFLKKYLEKIIKLEQPRLVKLSEIAEKTNYFFSDPEYDKELLKWKNMIDGEIKESLEKSLEIASNISEAKFKLKNIEKLFLKEAEKAGDRGRLLWSLRAALSGKKASPGPFEIADILGKKKVLERIKKALGKLR